MYAFIITIVCIVLFIKNKNLKEKVKISEKKEKKISNDITFCPNCGTNLHEYFNNQENNKNVIGEKHIVENNNINLNTQRTLNENILAEKIIQNTPPHKEKNKLSSKEQKNNLILITGASLIVLSAIIFLMTTWTSTGNITKTITIFLMLIVFFIISRISDIKFNLKQTSRVFLYIALCYIPISLLSIPLFGLFGNYLSITGSGKYIYFTLSCFLVSLIYYYTYNKHLKTPLLRMLLELFMLITIIFSSLIFVKNEIVIGIFITIYLIIRQLLTIKNNQITETTKSIYSFANISLLVYTGMIVSILEIINIETILFGIISLVSLYLLFTKINQQPKIYDYIYPIGIIFISILLGYCNQFNLNDTIREVIILLSFILITTFEILTSKTIKKTSFILITISSILISLINTNFYTSIIFIIYLIITYLYFILHKEERKNVSHIITLLIPITTALLTYDFNLPYFIILISSLLLTATPLLYNDLDNDLKTSFTTFGNVINLITFISVISIQLNWLNLLLSLISTIIITLTYLVYKNEYIKYTAYSSLTFTIIVLLKLFNINSYINIGLALGIIISLLFEIISLLNNNKNKKEFLVAASVSLLIVLETIEYSLGGYLIFLIGTITVLLTYIFNKIDFIKYIGYIMLSFSTIFLLNTIDFSIPLGYGLIIGLILTILVDLGLRLLKYNDSYIYILILSAIVLSTTNYYIINETMFIDGLLSIILIDILLYLYSSFINKDKYLSYILAFSLAPNIYFNTTFNQNICAMASLLIIGIFSLVSYQKRKPSSYTAITWIHILLLISCLDISIYLKMITLAVLSLAHYLAFDSKIKDIFKFLIYTSILIIIETLYKDFINDGFTVIYLGSILVYSILCSRTILKKYLNNYKNLEYIITCIINLITITSYISELDGILYVSLLIILIFISYIYRIGPVLLTSIVFVLLNMFILTREFWFSLPWWIYVLCAGIILILFAVNNEKKMINNNTQEKIKDIKEKLDL